jgi:hypothetical protein
MHPDNNARSGDRLPEISNSSYNAKLTNILQRLVAVEVLVGHALGAATGRAGEMVLLALGNVTRIGNITMNPIKFSNALPAEVLFTGWALIFARR